MARWGATMFHVLLYVLVNYKQGALSFHLYILEMNS